MDLTEFGLDNIDAGEGSSSGGGKSIEPGIYNLSYDGSEMVEGKNGWKALKLFFEVESTTIRMSHAFTMDMDNKESKAISIGRDSLSMMLNAMGVKSMKNTDELVGQKVQCLLSRGDNGYLEIDDDFGKNWKPFGTVEANAHATPKEVLPKEEMFPDDVEDEDDLPF